MVKGVVTDASKGPGPVLTGRVGVQLTAVLWHLLASGNWHLRPLGRLPPGERGQVD